jgi:molecular chaperone DnaK (HSP70)
LITSVSLRNYRNAGMNKELNAQLAENKQILKNVDDRINNDEWINSLVQTTKLSKDSVTAMKRSLKDVKTPIEKAVKKEDQDIEDLAKLLVEDNSVKKKGTSPKMI